MAGHKVFTMLFSNIYPLYVQKVEKKGRTREDVDSVISWLTGYTASALLECVEKNITLEQFINNAPQFNKDAKLIKGVICGYRVEDIEDPLMQKIRYMDKLVDELAKGKPLDKVIHKEDLT